MLMIFTIGFETYADASSRTLQYSEILNVHFLQCRHDIHYQFDKSLCPVPELPKYSVREIMSFKKVDIDVKDVDEGMVYASIF